METKRTAFGTAGLVVGIIGISLSLIPIINNAAFFLGILALIFGIITLVKKGSLAKGVVAIILGILAVVFTLVAQNNASKAINQAIDDLSSSLEEIGGDKTDELLGTSIEVTFGKFIVEKDSYFTDTALPVTVKNLTSEKKSFSVKVEAVDENGDRLEDTMIFISDLLGGQSITEKAFTLLDDNTAEQLKTAEFRVVKVSMY